MKWMVAVCTLAAGAALAQMEGSPGATASLQPQPPAELLPPVGEGFNPPATAKSNSGVSSPARRHRRSRYPRSGARTDASAGHGKPPRPVRHF